MCENGSERTITYAALLARVNQLANALRADGVRAGDRVCIYMPLTIEGIVAMLACARIGAIHSVIYAGLGATALRDRIADAGAQVLIVADVTYRKGRPFDLKRIVDDARARQPTACAASWSTAARPARRRPTRARSTSRSTATRSRPSASRRSSPASTRCSSSTPAARPASPRAW